MPVGAAAIAARLLQKKDTSSMPGTGVYKPRNWRRKGMLVPTADLNRHF